MTGIAPGQFPSAAEVASAGRGPGDSPTPNSLAQWGGRRLGFPTAYSHRLSREPILDGLLSDEPGLATIVPRVGNEPPSLGRLLAILWVRSGLRHVARLEVRGLSVTIGSDAANDLVVDAPGVSPHHARLSLAGGVWTLGNLAAVKDSWVDGARVEASLPVAPGSEVRIGTVVLSFAPRDKWSDSPPPKPDRPASVLTGPLFLPPEDTVQTRHPLARAAVVLIVCLLAYLVLAGH